MTGQKNRFKTTEKLWDLDDKQLKSPQHDAMVLWLMDETNLSIYYPIFDFKEYYSEEIINGQYQEVLHTFKGVKIDSEVPIMSSKTFIAGYGDLVIIPKYSFSYQEGRERERFNHFNSCLIEVKPYIDSFGAVLRQIKSYKKFSDYLKYCLFTLDDRFDAQFESQGIKVLHPPADITIDNMRKMYGL